jgi:hypothetical protein
MEDIFAMLIPMVGFVCLVAIIKIVTDNRVRRRLAETHATEDMVRSMFEADERSRHESSLKWGIVSVLVGVAIGLVDLFNLNPESPGTYSLVIIAAGSGLLLYYVTGHILRRKIDRD